MQPADDSRKTRQHFMLPGAGTIQRNVARGSSNNLNADQRQLLSHKLYGNRSCSDLSSKANLIALRSRQ